MGGTRGRLQHFVDAGYLTDGEAAEVAELIDTITEFVELGAMSPEEGDYLVLEMAREKAEAYHERALLG